MAVFEFALQMISIPLWFKRWRQLAVLKGPAVPLTAWHAVDGCQPRAPELSATTATSIAPVYTLPCCHTPPPVGSTASILCLIARLMTHPEPDICNPAHPPGPAMKAFALVAVAATLVLAGDAAAQCTVANCAPYPGGCPTANTTCDVCIDNFTPVDSGALW